MKAYLDIVKKVLEEGKWKNNRTGIRTLTVPNAVFSHNMSEGFPLLTTKKMPIKTIAVELEGFIKGITDKKWYQERGCKIWDEWCNQEQIPEELYLLDKNEKECYRPISGQVKLNWQKENPDLGKIYGNVWNDFNGYYKPIPFIFTGLDKTINIISSDDELVGNEYSGKYGRYTVISFDGKDKYHNKRYTIKFHNTGYIKNNLNKKQIIDTNIFDPYFPNILNIACVGEYDKVLIDKKFRNKLMLCWRAMIHRCYDKNNQAYKNYGEKGVYVSNRWLIFSNYLYDIQTLTGWSNKCNDWKNYQLDKDIGEGNCYSKENCMWVNREDNVNYTSQQYYFDAISPNGQIFKNNLGLSRFCRKHKLKVKIVEASITNKTTTHNGWKFIRHKNIKQLPKKYNQLKTIVDTLHTNPDDRRMVCSSWNPIQIDKMALPPCHMIWNLCHIDGVLNMCWMQRSVDSFLGLPFNIASYALLLNLLCKEANLIPGNLTGILVDCHIYENHIDSIEKQLTRTPKQLSNIDIINWKNIFDWKYQDIILENYVSYTKLSGTVAI